MIAEEVANETAEVAPSTTPMPSRYQDINTQTPKLWLPGRRSSRGGL